MNSIRKIFAILTPGDKILIISLLLSSFFMCYFLIFNKQTGKMAVIWVNGQEIKRLDLSREQQLELAGAQGEFIVQVKNNAVRMIKSTCPDKLCLQMGAINKPNQVIVCVPNRVIIKIEGGTSSEQFDLITE
ncbi:NusG domain II-containing protein [candidate division KSB1 bacterium]|nr:NusG domain II-containing protein [candidate division KSB1 bacterium]